MLIVNLFLLLEVWSWNFECFMIFINSELWQYMEFVVRNSCNTYRTSPQILFIIVKLHFVNGNSFISFLVTTDSCYHYFCKIKNVLFNERVVNDIDNDLSKYFLIPLTIFIFNSNRFWSLKCESRKLCNMFGNNMRQHFNTGGNT